MCPEPATTSRWPAAQRVEMRLEASEYEVVSDPHHTPGSLQARIAEIAVLQALRTLSPSGEDAVTTCSLQTEVVGLHRGGPVDVIVERLHAEAGGQFWMVETMAPDGQLIASSRIRLVRISDLA